MKIAAASRSSWACAADRHCLCEPRHAERSRDLVTRTPLMTQLGAQVGRAQLEQCQSRRAPWFNWGRAPTETICAGPAAGQLRVEALEAERVVLFAEKWSGFATLPQPGISRPFFHVKRAKTVVDLPVCDRVALTIKGIIQERRAVMHAAARTTNRLPTCLKNRYKAWEDGTIGYACARTKDSGCPTEVEPIMGMKADRWYSPDFEGLLSTPLKDARVHGRRWA